MITLFKRLTWLPMAGLALILTSILAFLYVRTQAHDASSYFENVATVRQLKQLDARWELDVMKSKTGINANYDALVDPLFDLNQLQEKLRMRVLGERHAAAAALIAADAAFGDAIQEKTRLIERFKSHNSVLRNSLVFLPTAAEDLRKAAPSGGAGSAKLLAAVNTVLLDTMVYSHAPTDDAAAGIRNATEQLAAFETGLPAPAKDGLDIFTSHVQAVLREQPLVNGLLRSIAAVPTTARIDAFDRLLGNEQKQVEQQTQRDRQYLLIFAAALVALFLYAAVRLIRSHAVINRINKDLYEANAGLEQRVEERTRELLTTNTALSATQGAMRNLLDNAEQGFLTVSPQLLVDDQSSAACEAILGENPAGKPILSLLCRRASQETQSAMATTLESVLRESSDYIRDLKIDLLPPVFDLDGKSIKSSYKFLADSGRLMLILTDVTETVQLTEAVERERKRLEMIVLAVTEGAAFAALVSSYRKFLAGELPLLLERIEAPASADQLRRDLHTYKGLLAQFSFHYSPLGLHAFENTLSTQGGWTPALARKAFAPEKLISELKLDLDGLADALGPDFVPTGQRTVLSQQQLQVMEQVAKDALAGADGRNASPPLRQLLQTLADLGKLDVKAALMLHGRGASTLATRLEKQLAPVQIEGDDMGLPPERYNAFFGSLVHVFRNAVDHGIETPEERSLAGKPAAGTIRCSVRDSGDWLEILIQDDGRGVDRSMLEERLAAMGLEPYQIKNLSLEDLVFREGLSSRNTADEVSGRGIGLAAVKTELDRLGGTVNVETGQGVGTRFCFCLLTKPDALVCDDAILGRAAT